VPYIYRRVVFDHLDKAFCILKLDNGGVVGGREDTVCHEETQELTSEEGPVRAKDDSTIIRRVDLIVSPPDQYPFALVSWTGSKQFNRSMRRYSVKECGMSVTAHGIYSMTEGTFLTASSERDVFSILKLAYLEPWERNC
jgi:DNA polymerase/3'-5' exonuclease PolX